MFRVFKTCNLFKQNKIFTRRMAAVNLKSLSDEKIYEFLNSFDTVLTDCDGVLWMEMTPIKNSAEVMNKFHDLGRQTFYVTNNSTKTREECLAKCIELNFHATKNNILCTSYLAACYLQDLGFKKKAYVIGSEGISKELEQVGIGHCGVGPDTIEPGVPYKTFQKDPDVGAVIVGFDQHFSYPKLLKAACYLNDKNVHFVGTNTDERFPMDGDIIVPGTGSLVKCVETCAERKAVIVGKPETYIAEAIIKRFNINPKRTLMIGDRCNTDILLGTRCGFKTLLVLSGVTSLADVNTWKQSNSQDKLDLLPHYYVDKLGDLLPYLEKLKPSNESA
ncbi:glycerol-3-phosphate phosphatase isoform X1 [Neodiprion virginianus]|uniref:glycerol-3-phosphate phosphatase isoform X1 n=1 Tax=Neodiprion fabricii TaxID=2872261 RepID=UPI001ED96719|nr:glycerol-3-phosphate phosphatase isoform X1 [Neodiprion fabricii]XP_046626828.1 glycerol-3-phosphate phosphatase isoform X1 [Neodiprion virginianus]